MTNHVRVRGESLWMERGWRGVSSFHFPFDPTVTFIFHILVSFVLGFELVRVIPTRSVCLLFVCLFVCLFIIYIWCPYFPLNRIKNHLTWLGLTWPDFIWRDLTWLDLTWLGLTRLDLTRPGLTWLGLTRLDLTWLDLTWLDLSWLDLTWLDLTWLGLNPSWRFAPLSCTPRALLQERVARNLVLPSKPLGSLWKMPSLLEKTFVDFFLLLLLFFLSSFFLFWW